MNAATLCVSKLETTYAAMLARHSSVIIAVDPCDFHEPIVLFESDGPFTLLAIELDPGDVLFESVNLASACKFVSRIKGCCLFQMTHCGHDMEALEASWPGDQRKPSDLLDDDEPADWWKRGAE